MPRIVHRPLLLATLSLTLLAAGCGDDDDEETSGGRTDEVQQEQDAQAGDVQRYCELSRELDRTGAQFFKRIEQDETATAKDYEAAERRFVRDHGADLDELGRVAPEAIRDDFRTVIASQRGRAGLGPPVSEKKSGPAEERVQKFEKRSCT